MFGESLSQNSGLLPSMGGKRTIEIPHHSAQPDSLGFGVADQVEKQWISLPSTELRRSFIQSSLGWSSELPDKLLHYKMRSIPLVRSCSEKIYEAE
jgi:hypothetical protein